MPNIQAQIQAAASRFAREVVSLLKSATLSEISSLTGRAPTSESGSGRSTRGLAVSAKAGADSSRRSGRGPAAGKKRSREEVARLAARVLEFLRSRKEEVGVSAIADALRVSTGDLGLPLSKLRSENKILTKGQKRSTVYRLA